MFDYSEAQQQREIDLIPHNTIATLQMTVRPGSAGEDGMLKRSQDGGCEMLDCEFVVVDGEFARRRLWERFILAGTTDGHAKAAEISRSKLRAILESARGVKPDDASEQARALRKASLADFNGIRFIARIGIEKGKPRANGEGEYPDRNVLLTVVSPDRKDWHAVEQVIQPQRSPADASAGPTVPAAIARPAWASES
jgi:hypothetical protein